MKTALAILLAATAAASPAVAQDFVRPLPPGPSFYDDPPVPPRPVPGYGGVTETVVTTTRRIVAPSPYGTYGAPQTVVTTRRVVAPAPVLDDADDVVATGSLRPAAYPPPRRVLKSGPDYGPVPVAAPLVRERVVVRREAQPVLVEERRVVTTRRVLHPAPAEALDWDE